jgi:drug/metabolite transporter (DMT)-like permease
LKALDLILLLLLSAIWGGSFMFMRYLAPILGPVMTAGLRLLIAGAALTAYFAATGYRLEWRKRWRRYLAVGLLNSAIPFLLFSFAALTIPANVEAVINALAPTFGALFSSIWLDERLTLRKIAGMVLGLLGVSLVSGLLTGVAVAGSLPAILACVAAPAFYGLAGIYIKKRAKDIEPRALAAGSQLLGGLALAPGFAFFPPIGSPTAMTVAAVAVFALLCSAVAYLIYYRLIATVGPTKALTVTFLIPVFGFVWGRLFLAEGIGPEMIAGSALILAGTFLVVSGGKRKGA